jgi:hypothetical protein
LNVSGALVRGVGQVAAGVHDAVIPAVVTPCVIVLSVKLPAKVISFPVVGGVNVAEASEENVYVTRVALAGSVGAAIMRTAIIVVRRSWVFISASPDLAVAGRPNDLCHTLRLAFA